MIKFYYNGLKTGDCPKLQLCSYRDSAEGAITIFGKHYRDFSLEVHAAFRVVNGTDIQTDYFENDQFRVEPSHPLYPHVLKAWGAAQEHAAKRQAKWEARRVAMHAKRNTEAAKAIAQGPIVMKPDAQASFETTLTGEQT